VANKQDEFGNYKEWSSRVRAAAAQSAAACSGVIPPETKLRDGEVPPAGEVPPVGDGEIPLRPQTKRGFFNRDKKVAAADTQPETTAGNNQKEAATLTRSDAAVRTSRDNRPQVQERTKVEASVAQRQEKVKPSSPAPLRQASATRDHMKSATTSQLNSTPPMLAARGSATPAAAQKELANKSTTKPAVHIDSIESKDDADPGAELMGTVTYVDVKTGSVRLSFAEGDQPRAGARADVFHKYLLRMQHLGELEIIGSSDGVTLARPTGELTIKQLSKGDRVIIH
jgi:hypothetical protein